MHTTDCPISRLSTRAVAGFVTHELQDSGTSLQPRQPRVYPPHLIIHRPITPRHAPAPLSPRHSSLDSGPRTKPPLMPAHPPPIKSPTPTIKGKAKKSRPGRALSITSIKPKQTVLITRHNSHGAVNLKLRRSLAGRPHTDCGSPIVSSTPLRLKLADEDRDHHSFSSENVTRVIKSRIWSSYPSLTVVWITQLD